MLPGPSRAGRGLAIPPSLKRATVSVVLAPPSVLPMQLDPRPSPTPGRQVCQSVCLSVSQATRLRLACVLCLSLFHGSSSLANAFLLHPSRIASHQVRPLPLVVLCGCVWWDQERLVQSVSAQRSLRGRDRPACPQPRGPRCSRSCPIPQGLGLLFCSI